MKKWMFITGLIVLVASVYIFVPGKLTVAAIAGKKFSIIPMSRYLADTAQWVRWWPHDPDVPIRKGSAFVYRGYAYTIGGIFYNRVEFSVTGAGIGVANGELRLAQATTDSVVMGSECIFSTGYAPVGRLKAYEHAKLLRENFDSVLRAFRAFMSDGRNLYGINIVHSMSDDSILVTCKGITPGYPTTEFIYKLIDSVRHYVEAEGAVTHNYPWLNVSQAENNQFRIQVALSINKQVKDKGALVMKRFVPWKMIEGDIKGGPHAADNAVEQLYKYRDDNHLSIMSIPIEMLITDRRKEVDTTKWVTRVTAPIS